jgi:hypothetical protein
VDGNCRGIISDANRHLLGETEEGHEKPQSGQFVSRPTFERVLPSILRSRN